MTAPDALILDLLPLEQGENTIPSWRARAYKCINKRVHTSEKSEPSEGVVYQEDSSDVCEQGVSRGGRW